MAVSSIQIPRNPSASKQAVPAGSIAGLSTQALRVWSMQSVLATTL